MSATMNKMMGVFGALMILGASGMAGEAEARGKGGKGFHGGGHRMAMKFHGGGGHRFVKHRFVKHHFIKRHRFHVRHAYIYTEPNYCLEHGWYISPYGHKRWGCLEWAY
jgi:hypothetical protein